MSAYLAGFTKREKLVLIACRGFGTRHIGLDGRQRFYEAVGRWHDYTAEVAALTERGLITPGVERYELTAAGHALFGR